MGERKDPDVEVSKASDIGECSRIINNKIPQALNSRILGFLTGPGRLCQALWFWCRCFSTAAASLNTRRSGAGALFSRVA